MNDKPVYRTASATPGLLIMLSQFSPGARNNGSKKAATGRLAFTWSVLEVSSSPSSSPSSSSSSSSSSSPPSPWQTARKLPPVAWLSASVPPGRGQSAVSLPHATLPPRGKNIISFSPGRSVHTVSLNCVHCALYTVHCSLYTVQCTLYSAVLQYYRNMTTGSTNLTQPLKDGSRDKPHCWRICPGLLVGFILNF